MTGKQILAGVMGAAVLAGGLVSPTLPSAQAQTSDPTWAVVDPGPNADVDFSGVYMVNGTNGAWAVGAQGTKGPNSMPMRNGYAVRLRWDGQHWVQQLRDTFDSPLHAVVAISDNNVWAVGDNGLIVHRYNGEGDWEHIPSPVPDADLTAIQMFGNGEEGWAVGHHHNTDPAAAVPNATVLLHYQNGVWRQDTPITGVLAQQALHFGGGAGYTVGIASASRYAQGTWQAETVPCRHVQFGCSTTLNDVRAMGGGEAWAVGVDSPRGPGQGNFNDTPLLLHRVNGTWQDEKINPAPAAKPATGDAVVLGGLYGMSLGSDGQGFAVGAQRREATGPATPLIVSRLGDGQWYYATAPYVENGMLQAVSQADAGHALAVGNHGLIVSYGYPQPGLPPPVPTATPAPGSLPTARVPDPHLPGALYFPQVGHSLQGGFRVYWEAHGGLVQFDYPITEAYQESGYTTQYFERARFERHPENKPPYDVLLGLLGDTVTAGRHDEPTFRPTTAQTDSRFFAATGHNLAPQFAAYWDTHGDLPVYGYPISEAFTEVSATDGKPYLVQYFERNRLEYHPELPEAYRVSLGLLGVDILRARGWLP